MSRIPSAGALLRHPPPIHMVSLGHSDVGSCPKSFKEYFFGYLVMSWQCDENLAVVMIAQRTQDQRMK